MYIFSIIKINLMLMEITPLQSASMSIIGSLTQNPSLVSSCRANVGPTKVFQLLKLQCWANNRSMPARKQLHVANNSNHFPTLAQRSLAIWVVPLLFGAKRSYVYQLFKRVCAYLKGLLPCKTHPIVIYIQIYLAYFKNRSIKQCKYENIKYAL